MIESQNVVFRFRFDHMHISRKFWIILLQNEKYTDIIVIWFLQRQVLEKSIIAAFDYKAFKEKNPRARLLFVAHRKEILEQSIQKFQEVLNDFNFGELYVDGYKPTDIEHLFISIQSFNSAKLSQWTSKDYYDFIIVDEFHHAAADSYQELLAYYEPKILLGLTATPDRMDGKDILKYFDGRIASKLLLGEAIDRNLLSSFQYFGVTD